MAFFCARSGKTGKSKKNGKSKSKTGPFPLGGENSNLMRSQTQHPRMIIVQDYNPQDAKGLVVMRGDIVELLGGEKEWMYVRGESGVKGFVPRSHCMVRPPNVHDDLFVDDIECHRSHSTPNPPFFEERNPDMRSVSTSFILEDGRKRCNSRGSLSSSRSQHSPNNTLDRRNGSRSQSQSKGTRHSLNEALVFGLSGKASEETPRTTARRAPSEPDMVAFRCRPLPAVPTEREEIQSHEGIYHTIMRDSSRSPERTPSQDCRDSTPFESTEDPYRPWSDSRQIPLGLNPVSQGRHSSTNDSTSSRGSGHTGNTLSLYRTLSDTPRQGDRSSIPTYQSDLESVLSDQPDVSRFRKVVWGVYEAVRRFDAVDENEISLVKGERVSLLNQDDPDWFWVVRMENSNEGFVPKCYLREYLTMSVGEAEYDQVITKPKASSSASRSTPGYTARSKSLPRNATLRVSTGAAPEERRLENSPRGIRPFRTSSPGNTLQLVDWGMDAMMSSPGPQGVNTSAAHHQLIQEADILYEQGGRPPFPLHQLHQSARKTLPYSQIQSDAQYKRHSTDDHLFLNSTSLFAPANSEDSGIIPDNDGTLV